MADRDPQRVVLVRRDDTGLDLARTPNRVHDRRRVAGEKAVKLIRREPDPMIMKIVSGWARDFDTSRAASLGFTAERSFDEIIRVHIEDELGGRLPD